MEKIKYIYFEINRKSILGVGSTNKIIENENALLFKPHTNSSGVWGYTNMTESQEKSDKKTYIIVDQNWIDLEKFEKVNNPVYDKLKIQVSEVLEKLNKKIEELN